MKIFLTICAVIIFTNVSVSQTRNELWGKYNISAKINVHFSAAVDINFRQQANYLTNDKTFYRLPLMRGSRLWLYYNLQKNYAVLGSFLLAKTFMLQNEKAELLNATETQIDLGLTKKIKLHNVENRNRLLLERREICPDNKSAIHQFRYRLQNSLEIPLKAFSASNKLNFILQNEVLFKTQQSSTGFDQNRTACILQWRYNRFGYQVGFQKGFQHLTDQSISKNQVLLTLNCSL